MREACLSIKALYDKFGEHLTYGKILVDRTDDNNYYDLLVSDGIACMDGEVCEIVHKDDNAVTLVNHDGEVDMTFKLTREEFGVANFS